MRLPSVHELRRPRAHLVLQFQQAEERRHKGHDKQYPHQLVVELLDDVGEERPFRGLFQLIGSVNKLETIEPFLLRESQQRLPLVRGGDAQVLLGEKRVEGYGARVGLEPQSRIRTRFGFHDSDVLFEQRFGQLPCILAAPGAEAAVHQGGTDGPLVNVHVHEGAGQSLVSSRALRDAVDAHGHPLLRAIEPQYGALRGLTPLLLDPVRYHRFQLLHVLGRAPVPQPDAVPDRPRQRPPLHPKGRLQHQRGRGREGIESSEGPRRVPQRERRFPPTLLPGRVGRHGSQHRR
mmetsp:Transcript_11795/g.25531  ORF Transcript_11795/g.25531 Transcript_11795/m.25531 type:complete len:291 (-) Transcript_11795:462-1334(-)